MDNKRERLIKILQDHFHYSQTEINDILNHILPFWYTFLQTNEEIIQQVHTEYALWRGLGTAILNYVQWEKNQC